MGVGYCSGCKEYYYCTTTEINRSTQEILNSHSSYWTKFNNPFFPRGVEPKEFIVIDTGKNLEEKEKEEEEKEKEKEEEEKEEEKEEEEEKEKEKRI